MPKTITKNQLTAGNVFLVRGKVGFSRITRKTTDQERALANAKRTYPIDKNYTQMTIYDATVIAKDPQNPTLEERYAAENLYVSSIEGYTGQSFNAMSKGNIPEVLILTGPNTYQPIKPEAELDSGLDVTLMLRVFRGKQFANQGVTLDRVLVNEPIRYMSRRDDNKIVSELASYGIIYQKPEKPLDMDAAEEEAATAPINDEDATPFSAPGDNAPIGGPTDTPFSSQPNGGYQFASPTAGRVY